jgi:hypothetical protein
MRSFLITLAIAGAATTANAQWLNRLTPGIPRTADGKPNLEAPIARTGDGRPDLSDISGAYRYERQH